MFYMIYLNDFSARITNLTFINECRLMYTNQTKLAFQYVTK